MQASLIKASLGHSTLNYSVDIPCLTLSNSYNLSFHFYSCRPRRDRNKGQYFNNNCYLLALLNDLLIKLKKCLFKSPPRLARSSMSEMEPKGATLPLLHAFGSIQIDLIYHGPQNSGISYNFCHMSSTWLLKINSPERKWLWVAVCNLLLSVIYYPYFQGNLKEKTSAKQFPHFILNKNSIEISLPLAVHAFESSRTFSYRLLCLPDSLCFLYFLPFRSKYVFENENNHRCMMLIFDRYPVLSSVSYAFQHKPNWVKCRVNKFMFKPEYISAFTQPGL